MSLKMFDPKVRAAKLLIQALQYILATFEWKDIVALDEEFPSGNETSIPAEDSVTVVDISIHGETQQTFTMGNVNPQADKFKIEVSYSFLRALKAPREKKTE